MKDYLRKRYPSIKTVNRDNWECLLETARSMKNWNHNEVYQYVVNYIGIDEIRPYYPLCGDLLEISKRIENEHLNGLSCNKYWNCFFSAYTDLISVPVVFVDEHLYTKSAILHEIGVDNTISCAVCTIKQAVRIDLINANLWQFGNK